MSSALCSVPALKTTVRNTYLCSNQTLWKGPTFSETARWLLGEKSSSLLIQLILSPKVSFRFAKGITLRTATKLLSTDQAEPSPLLVRRNKMLLQQKRTQLPSIEYKTQTQQTKHSVAGVFCSNLELDTAGERPCLSVFVEIFVWCTRFSFVGLKPYSQLPFLFYYLSTMCHNFSVELAEGKYTYTLLSNIISRVFQNWQLQNYKRNERFIRVNWVSQFPTSSLANSLPVYGTLLRQNKSTLKPEKIEF